MNISYDHMIFFTCSLFKLNLKRENKNVMKRSFIDLEKQVFSFSSESLENHKELDKKINSIIHLIIVYSI